MVIKCKIMYNIGEKRDNMANKKKEIVEEAVVKEEKEKVVEETEKEVKTEKVKSEDIKNEDEKNIADRVEEILKDVKDTSKDYTKEDKKTGKGYALVSYLGILCLIPFFCEKENKFVMYHAKQGLNLVIDVAIATVALWLLAIPLLLIPILGWLLIFLLGFGVNVGAIVLSVIGIVNACKGEAKELPLVNKLRIIK